MKMYTVLLLWAAVAANAQLQICQNIKPGKVPAVSIKMTGTENSGSYSSITVNWPRPADGTPPSCITEYQVQVSGRDGRVFQSATVPVSAAHTSASHTAKGLLPGQPYQWSVIGKGAGGSGEADIRSTPFTAAPATSSCRQPQAVSNIRRVAASPSGSKVSMTIACDKSSTAPECVKEYVINVYEAGSQTILKTATVPAPSTQYTDNIYNPGKSYEFYIFARNPSVGALGNGVGLRSAPIIAPAGATPL